MKKFSLKVRQMNPIEILVEKTPFDAKFNTEKSPSKVR